MKFLILFCGLLALTLAEKYSTENDDLDIEALIKNDAEFKSFLDCFNEKIPCEPVPAQFKSDLTEAVETACRKCTDAQKIQMKRFLEHTIQKYPKEFQVFSKIYDKDSKHLVALMSALSAIPYVSYLIDFVNNDGPTFQIKLDVCNSYFVAHRDYNPTFGVEFVGLRASEGGGLIVVNIKALSLSVDVSSVDPIDTKSIMKTFVVLACLVLAVFAADKYNSKYDNFDVQTLITNERLLKSYINCFLDKGRCTAEGSDFKKALPEALETTCGKCTDKQKDNIRKVVKTIQQKYPEQWKELAKKNDPTGKFTANFEKFVNEG
ncbi:uncharacterized protein LOC121737410 [Aricia agestis]|uniref:uncharacterized protein LOC121737410 n=1 Tax=Aricia agestis TaxID=91739 RepID=UPI001C204446|nr:uncharacterized protein LOC121737410 [Aricia agestis]